jgi:hypothetical protein
MVRTCRLHELEVPFDAALTDVHVSTIRAAFAELAERAIPLLNRQQLDLDEVLLEHVAYMRDASDDVVADHVGGELPVVLPTLADPGHWIRAYDDARRMDAGSGPCRPETARFCRLVLRVLRELDSPLPDFRVSDGV